MANTFQVTQKVADMFLEAFYANFVLLDYCNTELAAEYTQGQFGIGQSVQIRKYPRYLPSITAIPQSGDLNLPIDNIQQETETLTIDKLITTGINLNAVESALNVRTEEAIREEFIMPAVQSVKKQVINEIYDKFVQQSYYISGSAGSVINSHSVIADGVAVMQDVQMPENKHICMSPRDRSQLAPTLGAYFQREASTRALMQGEIIGIDDYSTASWNDSIRIHTAGTASAVTGLTLSIAAVNGATNLTIAGLVATNTLNVGDVITITNPAVFALSPIDKKNVDPNVYQMSYVVAPDNTGTNPDYVQSDATDPLTGVYTSTGATMTVSIFDKVRSGTGLTPPDHFQNVTGPANTLPAGSTLFVSGSHRANMGISMGGISIAAPAVDVIENAQFSTSTFKGISIFVGKQGNLRQFTNAQFVGLQLAIRVHPEYCLRQISGA